MRLKHDIKQPNTTIHLAVDANKLTFRVTLETGAAAAAAPFQLIFKIRAKNAGGGESTAVKMQTDMVKITLETLKGRYNAMPVITPLVHVGGKNRNKTGGRVVTRSVTAAAAADAAAVELDEAAAAAPCPRHYKNTDEVIKNITNNIAPSKEYKDVAEGIAESMLEQGSEPHL